MNIPEDDMKMMVQKHRRQTFWRRAYNPEQFLTRLNSHLCRPNMRDSVGACPAAEISQDSADRHCCSGLGNV